MTSNGAAKRLLIAVEPRLLADTLARAMGTNYEVLTADPATWDSLSATPDRFDVAITTTPELPAWATVDRLLVLPAPTPSSELGVLRTAAGDRTVSVGGLDAILAALDGLESPAVGK